jgi:hypothetical protein
MFEEGAQMRVLEALTKLVVGMSRFGDHLLSRKVSGVIVAALAFACGAGLFYVLKREARPAPAVKSYPATSDTSTRRAETAPAAPGAAAAAPAYDAEEEEYGTRELQEWKHRHGGATLPLDYDAVPDWSELSESKVVVLPSGRTLASAGTTLYMLGADKRVVWKHELPQPAVDFAHVASTGVVCATAHDNYMFILDAATGRELVSNSRQGRGGYGAVLTYGEDVCLIADALGGYNVDYRGGPAPMPDGVTAWRGTRMLWHAETPPGAELQVVGSKVYAVTKTRDRILVKELDVPQR